MNETKIKEIADSADMIIRGYAFSNKNGFIYVFNTNDGMGSMIMKPDGTMLATNMDEIEQALVAKLWVQNKKYMEEENAEIL